MHLTRLLSPALAFLAVALAVRPGSAQDPTPRPPDLLLPISTEVVRIDVVVTDKGGRPRTDLRREDFVVLEDGQAQQIAQFEAIVGKPGPPAHAVPGAPAAADPDRDVQAPAGTMPPPRYVVLAVDDVHIEAGNLLRIKKALDRFLEREVGPEDQLALVTTSGTRGIFQEFTDDRHAMRRSVDRLSVQDRTVVSAGLPYMTEYQAQQIDRGDPEALRVAVEEVQALGLLQDENAAERQARAVARQVLAESINHARITLETLDSVVRGLSELQGRKVVALVSDGFLAGLTTGADAAFDIRRITDASTRAGVVIYALDTRGLVATNAGRSASSRLPVLPNTFNARDILMKESELATRDAIGALAADSGGFLVQGTNDLSAGLRRILKDTENFYAVAYESTNTKRDGAFHKIEVRLPGVRDVRIRARKGYFAPDDRKAKRLAPRPPQPAAEDPAQLAADEAREADARRQADLRMALTSLAPLGAIPVRLSVDFVSAAAGSPQAVVSSHVDLNAVPFVRKGDRHAATVDIAATVFDESGSVVGSLAPERAVMELTDGKLEDALKRGLQYQRAVTLEPGRYRVRVAVREDGGGRLGGASHWVTVPDLADGKLTLSSLFLMKKVEEAGPDAADPAAPALLGVQALRRFKRDESLYVQLHAYNPRPDAAGATDLVTQTEIWRRGALLASSAPEPMGEDGEGPITQTRSIKLAPFEAGDYEVRLVVTDRNCNAMASKKAGFTIE
jgi:VWFA-related protein